MDKINAFLTGLAWISVFIASMLYFILALVLTRKDSIIPDGQKFDIYCRIMKWPTLVAFISIVWIITT